MRGRHEIPAGGWIAIKQLRTVRLQPCTLGNSEPTAGHAKQSFHKGVKVPGIYLIGPQLGLGWDRGFVGRLQLSSTQVEVQLVTA